jgi:hypothetical protein
VRERAAAVESSFAAWEAERSDREKARRIELSSQKELAETLSETSSSVLPPGEERRLTANPPPSKRRYRTWQWVAGSSAAVIAGAMIVSASTGWLAGGSPSSATSTSTTASATTSVSSTTSTSPGDAFCATVSTADAEQLFGGPLRDSKYCDDFTSADEQQRFAMFAFSNGVREFHDDDGNGRVPIEIAGTSQASMRSDPYVVDVRFLKNDTYMNFNYGNSLGTAGPAQESLVKDIATRVAASCCD